MTASERFNAARLYVITCPPKEGPEGYAAMVESACAGGADVVQFRDKTLTWKGRYEIAGELRKICRRYRALFIVNDAVDLALAVQADGVHLGQDDLPQVVAEQLVQRAGATNFLIGRSTHSLEQARQAAREGADYIGIGPVFATPTKPTSIPVGLQLVREVTSQVKTPHVAIGGIDAGNLDQVLTAGAQRIAVVRAVCGAPDIQQAAKQMKDAITRNPPAPPFIKGGTKRGFSSTGITI